MKHEIIKEQLLAFYDGELDSSARTDVEAHLSSCVECRGQYERWAKTAKVFFRATQPETSEFFVQSVMNQIHALETPKRAPNWNAAFRWLVPAMGVAAMLFAVMRPVQGPFLMDRLIFGSQNAGFSGLSGKMPTTDETLEFVMGAQL